MQVIVDDQLALLVATEAIRLPPRVELPVLTTYGFRLRIVAALLPDRPTDGVLSRLVAHLPSGRRAAVLDSDAIHTPNPVSLVGEIADVRARHRTNLLAAEVVALAGSTGHRVVVSEPNATGTLGRVLREASVHSECWTVGAEASDRLAVIDRRSLGSR